MANNIWSFLKVPPPGQHASDAPAIGPTGRTPSDPLHVVAPPHEPTRAEVMRDQAAETRRLLRLHPPAPVYPRPNQLYDNLRTREAWRYTVEATSHGTFTPASGTTTVAVAYDAAPTPANLRLDQFPKGTHAYPVLIYFSYAPVATSGTGELSWQFQPATGGIPVPLGEYNLAQASIQNQLQIILDAPMTDPGASAAGNLIVTGNTVATPAAVFWRIAWGFAYLLPEPAFLGYEAVDNGESGDHARESRQVLRAER